MVELPLWIGYALSFSIPSTTSYPVWVGILPALASVLVAVAVAMVVIPAESYKANALDTEAVQK